MILLLVNALLLTPLIGKLVGDQSAMGSHLRHLHIKHLDRGDTGCPLPANRAQSGGRGAQKYVAGDRNLRHNSPGRPVNDPFLALLFTAGWLAALFRIKQPWARLLLIWLAVMLLPTILSTPAPHAFHRHRGRLAFIGIALRCRRFDHRSGRAAPQ